MQIRSKFRQLGHLLKFSNPLQIIVNRLIWPGCPVVSYQYRGVTALVDHSRGDQDGVRSCLVPGLYDPFLNIILKETPGPLRILDLGANTGGFALALLAHQAKIEAGLAVELNPLTCTRLSLNLGQNGLLQKVAVLNAAVSGKPGTLTVSLGRGSVSDSIYSKQGPDTLQIRGWTIDELITTHFPGNAPIDLCKIDIEGAEHEVFGEDHCQLLQRCRWILIEIHGEDRQANDLITARLAGWGFEAVLPLTAAVESNVFMFRNK